MQTSPKKHKKIIWNGLLVAVAYWLLETVRFSNLFTEANFIQALANPGLLDSLIRALVVLAIVCFSLYASRLLKRENHEKVKFQNKLESKDYTLATANTPIVVLNESLRILEINKAAARLTGTKAETFFKKHVLTALFHKNDFEKIEKALLSNPNKPDFDIGMVKLRVKHAKECWVTFTTATESDKEKITKIYLFLNDVSPLASQLTETENALNTLKERAEEREEQIEFIKTSLENELQHKTELESKIQLWKKRHQEQEQKINLLQSKVAELSEQRTKIENEFVAKQSEFDSINQKHQLLQEQYESLLTEQQTTISANKNLRTELEILQTQTEKISLPILKLDYQGIVQASNPAAQTLLGIDQKESLKNHLSSQEEKQRFVSLINSLKQNEVAVSTELSFTTNNQHILLNCHATAIDEAEQILLYGYDITPFKLPQQELATSLDHSRFEIDELLREMEMTRTRTTAILGSIDDGIIIIDLYNRITMMNPAAEDILGIRLSQALERPINFILREPILLEQVQKTLQESLQDNNFQLKTRSFYNNQPITLEIKTVVIKNKYLREEGVLLRLRKNTNIIK